MRYMSWKLFIQIIFIMTHAALLTMIVIGYAKQKATGRDDR